MAIYDMADEAISNLPADAPELIDVSQHVFADFNADSVTLAAGAEVASWQATGNGPNHMRILNATSKGYAFPKMSLTGGPWRTKGPVLRWSCAYARP